MPLLFQRLQESPPFFPHFHPLCSNMRVTGRKLSPIESDPSPSMVDIQLVKTENKKGEMKANSDYSRDLVLLFHQSPRISSIFLTIRTCPRTERIQRKPTGPCRWTEPVPEIKKKTPSFLA